MKITDKRSRVEKAAQEVKDLVTELKSVREVFKPFKPQTKAIRFDYLTRSSEIRVFLKIPEGLRRKTGGKVEIPVFSGYSLHEIMDLETFNILPLRYELSKGKWIFKANSFPDSERYLISLRGTVSEDFLNSWVKLTVPSTPKSEDTRDRYWIHAALKDASVLQEIHEVFSVDRVTVGVNVGVQRLFSSAIPKEVEKRWKATREFLAAAEGHDRDWIRKRYVYRAAVKRARITPVDFTNLINELISGDFFKPFVTVDDPFHLGRIEGDKHFETIPERVKVEIHTNLDLENPAAEGNLCFERTAYDETVKSRIDELMPEEKERQRKKNGEPIFLFHLLLVLEMKNLLTRITECKRKGWLNNIQVLGKSPGNLTPSAPIPQVHLRLCEKGLYVDFTRFL